MKAKKQVSKTENERIDAMYKGLFELVGMAKTNITNASTTIDDILYGENGTWRGTQEEDE
jgi:hypothetical protein